MSERAKVIQLGVSQGLTNLDDIKGAYNKYARGEELNNYSAGAVSDALYKAASEEESLGKPSHNYDFTQSEQWADAHGYYPDERGHRDDRVKKPAHPTHTSRGTWNGLNEFQLTDIGMEDPNYTIFGMADGGQDPQAIMTYNGSIVLPELTVTPKGNYIHNSYDNLNLHFNKKAHKYDGEREPTQQMNTGLFGLDPNERLISTGNEYGDIALSFVPLVGSGMDIETALREPSPMNFLWATLSTASDIVGGSLLKGAYKTYKAYKAFKTASSLEKASKAARVGARRAYRTGNYTKYERLTKQAQDLENRVDILRGDTEGVVRRALGEAIEPAPKFTGPLTEVFKVQMVGNGVNGSQLIYDNLMEEAYPNGIK